MKSKTTPATITSALGAAICISVGVAISTGSVLGAFFIGIGIMGAICSVNIETSGVGDEIESLINDEPDLLAMPPEDKS